MKSRQFRLSAPRPLSGLGILVAVAAVAISAAGSVVGQAARISQDEDQIASDEAPGICVVRNLIECFNRHDAEAMTALMHADCEISYVSEDGKSQLSANKAAAIEKEMAQYFQHLPTVQSEIRQAIQAGNFVTVEEHVEWSVGETTRSQASLGVFEVADGKIRRVWYYPAYR